MKTIYQLFILLISVVSISCSNDGENDSINPPSNSIKKITETTYNGGTTNHLSVDFNYDNGVLKSMSDATNKLELFYTGSKISSSKISSNNIVTTTYSFGYNGDLLETILNTTNNFERTFYSYTNGILASEKNQSLINSSWQTIHTNNYVLSNGNIVEENKFTQNNFDYKYTYEYDTKLNPMNYMNPVLRNIVGLESCDFKNFNNKIKTYNYSNSDLTTPILNIVYQITYNTQNLPVTIKKYTSSNILVSEATFEYN